VLALGLLLLGVAALAGVTLVPVWLLSQSYGEGIETAERRLAAQRRLAAAGAGLEPKVDQLKRRQGADRRYLQSTSEALAGAELQGIVKRVVPPRGGQVLSTQIVGSQQEAGFTRVTLKLKMRATLEKLVEVFFALETGTPYLFLDNVAVRTLGGARFRSAATAMPEQPLDVELELSGYMRGEES
jgi:general secretion pathway protein M